MDKLKQNILHRISLIEKIDINEQDKDEIIKTLKAFIIFLVEKEAMGIDNNFTEEKIGLIKEYLTILSKEIDTKLK